MVLDIRVIMEIKVNLSKWDNDTKQDFIETMAEIVASYVRSQSQDEISSVEETLLNKTVKINNTNNIKSSKEQS